MISKILGGTGCDFTEVLSRNFYREMSKPAKQFLMTIKFKIWVFLDVKHIVRWVDTNICKKKYCLQLLS
jgi:hypothetical protein